MAAARWVRYVECARLQELPGRVVQAAPLRNAHRRCRRHHRNRRLRRVRLCRLASPPARRRCRRPHRRRRLRIARLARLASPPALVFMRLLPPSSLKHPSAPTTPSAPSAPSAPSTPSLPGLALSTPSSLRQNLLLCLVVRPLVLLVSSPLKHLSHPSPPCLGLSRPSPLHQNVLRYSFGIPADFHGIPPLSSIPRLPALAPRLHPLSNVSRLDHIHRLSPLAYIASLDSVDLIACVSHLPPPHRLPQRHHFLTSLHQRGTQ